MPITAKRSIAGAASNFTFLPSSFRSKQLLLILRSLYKQLVPLVTTLEKAPAFGCRADDLKLTIFELQEIHVFVGFHVSRIEKEPV